VLDHYLEAMIAASKEAACRCSSQRHLLDESVGHPPVSFIGYYESYWAYRKTAVYLHCYIAATAVRLASRGSSPASAEIAD